MFNVQTFSIFINWVDLHTCQITTALNTGFFLTANLLNTPRTLLICGSSYLTMHATVWTKMFLCHSIKISISLERLNQSSPFFHHCKGKSMTYLEIDITFSRFLLFLKYNPYPMIAVLLLLLFCLFVGFFFFTLTHPVYTLLDFTFSCTIWKHFICWHRHLAKCSQTLIIWAIKLRFFFFFFLTIYSTMFITKFDLNFLLHILIL